MSVLRKLSKVLAGGIGGPVALVLAIYGIALVVNLHDRPPSGAALQFAAAYRDRTLVADSENAFVYATGFYVKPGDDPQAAGVRRIAWMRTAGGRQLVGFSLPAHAPDYDYKSARSPAVQKTSDACVDAGHACLVALERQETLAEWSSLERWLFDRYLALTSRRGWRENAPLDPSMPLPPYAMILEGQKLLLVEAWRHARDKDAAGVQRLLAQDVRFWRHTLEFSDQLITKMIAIAALKRHFKVGDLVLRRLPVDLEAAGRPPEWSAEITMSERSMRRTFVCEWAFFNSAIELGISHANWWDSLDQSAFARVWQRAATPLLQPQDLSNEWADSFSRATDELDVPYDRYRAAVARADAILDGAKRGGGRPPIRLYNPVGSVLRWISGSSYASYSVRAVDIEGVRRAALVTSELRSGKIPAAMVPAGLSASPIRQPYDDKPFEWNAEQGALTFTGLEPLPRGRHEFIY